MVESPTFATTTSPSSILSTSTGRMVAGEVARRRRTIRGYRRRSASVRPIGRVAPDVRRASTTGPPCEDQPTHARSHDPVPPRSTPVDVDRPGRLRVPRRASPRSSVLLRRAGLAGELRGGLRRLDVGHAPAALVSQRLLLRRLGLDRRVLRAVDPSTESVDRRGRRGALGSVDCDGLPRQRSPDDRLRPGGGSGERSREDAVGRCDPVGVLAARNGRIYVGVFRAVTDRLKRGRAAARWRA
jgi:hypothetical protein